MGNTDTIYLDKTGSISPVLIPQNKQSLVEKYLKDITVPAKAIFIIAKSILGDFSGWECETIEFTLTKLYKDIPPETFQKIFACMSLDDNKNIILDTSSSFKNFAVIFNNQSPIADIDEVIHVAEATWAVVALNTFDPEHTSVYLDYEPIVYLSRLLHDEGFIVAPKGIGFCQAYLENLNQDMGDLVSKTEEALKSNYSDNPIIKIQLEKHRDVSDYVSSMHDNYSKFLKALSI